MKHDNLVESHQDYGTMVDSMGKFIEAIHNKDPHSAHKHMMLYAKNNTIYEGRKHQVKDENLKVKQNTSFKPK